MKITSLGTVIAVRELDILGKGKIVVTIGKPKRFPNATDYYCPYQITGIKRSSMKYAGGVDAVQALDLALKMIGVDLYTSDEARRREISWRGSDHIGDFGFPRP